MKLDPQAVRDWAKNRSHGGGRDAPSEGHDPDDDHEGKDHGDDHEDDEDGDRDGGGAPDELWAGKAEGNLEEVVTPERAEQLLSWMEEHEDAIEDAVTAYANACVDGDPDAQKQAEEDLLWAQQASKEGVPEFSEDERHAVLSKLEATCDDELEKGSPEFKQAVALALAEARAGGKSSGDHGDGEHDEEHGDDDDEHGDGGGEGKPKKPAPPFGKKKE